MDIQLKICQIKLFLKNTNLFSGIKRCQLATLSGFASRFFLYTIAKFLLQKGERTIFLGEIYAWRNSLPRKRKSFVRAQGVMRMIPRSKSELGEGGGLFFYYFYHSNSGV